MNREKVLELAQQCQLIGMRPHLDGIYEQSLQQFAALIEAEVRGDAESEARFALWEAINKRKFGNPTDDKLILEYLKQNGLWIGKYDHHAPAVVRQLVDGLTGLIDFIEIDNLRIDQDALRIAKEALAAAKENGL